MHLILVSLAFLLRKDLCMWQKSGKSACPGQVSSKDIAHPPGGSSPTSEKAATQGRISNWNLLKNFFYYKIVSNLHQNYKDSTENLHISLPSFPTNNIIHYHGTLVKLNDPILIHYYELKSKLDSTFLSFFLLSSFWSRTEPRRPCYTIPCLLRLLWLWQFLNLFCFWWCDSFWGVLVRCFVECFSVGV